MNKISRDFMSRVLFSEGHSHLPSHKLRWTTWETPNPVLPDNLHPSNWSSSLTHLLQCEHLCRNLHPNTRWVKPIWGCLLTRQNELANTSSTGLTSSPMNCPERAWTFAAFSFHSVQEARQLCPLCSTVGRLDKTNFLGMWAILLQVWTAQNSFWDYQF